MKRKTCWWIAAAVWCLAIFSFTESSFFTGANTEKILRHMMNNIPFIGAKGDQESSFLNLIIRKLTHFSVFGTLAFFVYKVLAPRRFAYIGAWSFVVVYAALDEWHQSFQPGRVPLVSDVFIDALGAAFALLLVRVYLRKKQSENNFP